MYLYTEVWWVVRTRSERRLQRRKGFNVTSPACTFDVTNNRYCPPLYCTYIHSSYYL